MTSCTRPTSISTEPADTPFRGKRVPNFVTRTGPTHFKATAPQTVRHSTTGTCTGSISSSTGWVAIMCTGPSAKVGWPSYEEMVASGLPAAGAADEAEHWNTLAGKWFERADAAMLTVTYFCASGTQRITYAGSPPGLPEANAVFVHAGGNGELRNVHGDPILGPAQDFQPDDIDTANSQYAVLSNHPSVGHPSLS